MSRIYFDSKVRTRRRRTTTTTACAATTATTTTTTPATTTTTTTTTTTLLLLKEAHIWKENRLYMIFVGGTYVIISNVFVSVEEQIEGQYFLHGS